MAKTLGLSHQGSTLRAPLTPCVLIILPICYWAIDKKLGTYLCVASFATLTVNGAVKDVAQIERPIFHEAIRYVEIENFFVDTVGLKGSYSFPSTKTFP